MLLFEITPQNINPQPGVYRVHALNFTCNRFLGADNSGLLYIGQASNLQRRLNYLRRACNQERNWPPHVRATRHVFAGTLFQLFDAHPTLLATYPQLNPFQLNVKFDYHDNPIQIEQGLLQDYITEYGEVPPLNFKR